MILNSDPPAALPRQQIDSVRFKEAISERRGDTAAHACASFADVSAQVEHEQSTATGEEEKPPAATSMKKFSLWENADFSFGDLVDIINPLQHLPIVATIYRNMTGDRIGALPRVVGGAIWGRIGGFVSGAVNAVVEWLTGKDLGDHIFAFFKDMFAAPSVSAIAAQKVIPVEAGGEIRNSSAVGLKPGVTEWPSRAPVDEADFAVQPSSMEPISPLPAAPHASVPSFVFAARYIRDQERDRSDDPRKFHLTV